jgi:hypothetical protein
MMPRMLFGLLLVPLIACSDVVAQEMSVPGANPGGAPGKPPIGQHPFKSSKPGTRTHPEARSLPLSSAAAYAAEHPISTPISPAPTSMPPPSRPWTGFYVGGGSGFGTTQP